MFLALPRNLAANLTLNGSSMLSGFAQTSLNWKGSSKPIESTPLLKIKGDLPVGCPIFSRRSPALERLPHPELMGTIVVQL